MIELLQNLNWLAVGQIILIDILLGGDNAIVIALACRNLPRELRLKGILWGTVGAIVLRVVLIAFAVTLLEVHYLKIAGGLMLFWIGIKLMGEDEDAHDGVAGAERLWTAVRTVIVADLVMSIDNVIAVSAAASQGSAQHQLALVIFGIGVSIPIIVGGSSFVLKLMEHFPIIITFGAAMLGYIAGGMVMTDAAVAPWVAANFPYAIVTWPVIGIAASVPGLLAAGAVVVIGHWLAWRARRRPD